MQHNRNYLRLIAAILFLLPMASLTLRADVVIDWNIRAGQLFHAARLTPDIANICQAIAQTATYEAVNAITGRYPKGKVQLPEARGASIEAAVAAANRITLSRIIPTQQKAIDSLYQAALRSVADGPAKSAGIAVGEKAAETILALRSADISPGPDSYRPITSPGDYVPTITPAATWLPKLKPWLMTSAAQFRPGPPPSLTSDLWTRDFNEIKAIGGKNSASRTPAQTEIARFWEETLPPIYCGVIECVARMPGREVTQNARLYAAIGQACEDALIAIFEAKYAYHFWRPVTAIRNADIDNNNSTERDSVWTPFIPTPMHPEYPCAHCIISGTIGTILKAELGEKPCPTLTTTSNAAGGASRSWSNLDDFMTEVANARIYDGVHYRNSTEVGNRMGRQIGELAIATFALPTARGDGR